ncbi:tetratricopeptide repeat protein [Chryseobacterium sp. 22532]|uniref:tetratricopeptide repeat protein n=1 Tax=Chryseobacterium sp. 22532 TaxID=3453938 RepID=UPI003F83D461
MTKPKGFQYSSYSKKWRSSSSFPFFKHIILLLLLVTCLHAKGQKNDKKAIGKIDSLIVVADDLYMNGKDRELILIVEKKIIPESKKNNYERGLCYGHFYIASCLSFAGKHLKSNIYIKKSQSYTSYLKSDFMQSSRNYGLIGDNLTDLGLYTAAAQNYHKAVSEIEKIKTKNYNDLLTQSTTYNTMANLYNIQNFQDSAYSYLLKERKILRRIPLHIAYREVGSSYSSLGNYYFFKKNLDSAEYYLQKSLSILNNKEHPYEIEALIGMGDLYVYRKRNDKAIQYYQEALSKASNDNLRSLGIIYKKLGDFYFKCNDIEKARKYSILGLRFEDSINVNMDRDRNFIVNEILEGEKEIYENENRKVNYEIELLVGVIILLLIIIYAFQKSKKQNDLKLDIKELEIAKKAAYTNELEQKLKISLHEVIEAAKKNSPVFFEKFQSLHPDFSIKLLEINGSLTTNELILLAYVYLNFSSKEIASYTFRSYRTVQSRKYMLRKKLNLETNQDLYLWLKRKT